MYEWLPVATSSNVAHAWSYGRTQCGLVKPSVPRLHNEYDRCQRCLDRIAFVQKTGGVDWLTANKWVHAAARRYFRQLSYEELLTLIPVAVPDQGRRVVEKAWRNFLEHLAVKAEGRKRRS